MKFPAYRLHRTLLRNAATLLVTVGAASPAVAQVWVHQFPDQAPTLRDVAATSSGRVIAVGDGGALLISSDRGETWSEGTLLPGMETGRMEEVEFCGSALLAAGQGIFRSLDGGVSWLEVDGTEGFIGLETIGGTHAWALTGDRTVMRSSDAGLTWTGSTVPSGFQTPLLSIDFADTNRGWIGGHNGEMFETLDGGATWLSRNQPGGWQSPTNSSVRGIHLTTQRSFLLELDEVWRGNTLGTSFVSAFFPWTTAANDFDFDGSFGLVVGQFGRIERTPNAGLDWVLALEDGGWEHHGVVMLGGGEAIVVGQSSRALKTTDSGLNWQVMNGPTGPPPTIPWVHGMHAIDSDTIVAAATGGKILRSEDAGNTWDLQDAGTPQTHLRAIHFFDAMNGYAVGEKQGFYPTLVSTHDGGQNWFEYNQLGMYDHWDVHAIGPDIACVASDSRIWRTADGGQSWTSTTPSPIGNYHAIDFVGQVGYAIGTQLIKSTNGGLSWTILEDPPIRYHGISFVDELVGLRVGEMGTIEMTTDGGVSWTPRSSGVTSTLRAVDVYSAQLAIVSGDNGVVLLTANGGASWMPLAPAGITTETLHGATFAQGSLWVGGEDAGIWRLGPPDVDCEVQNYCQGKVHSGGAIATLTSFGTPNVSNGSIGVGILNALPNTLAIGFESPTGAASVPIYNGTLCVQAPLTRLSVLSLDGSGFGFYTLPMTASMSGTTRWYQVLFRDALNPDGTGIGMSDGLMVTFCP